jgi:DNA-binding winged helix-turn-helix (wHTH) protein
MTPEKTIFTVIKVIDDQRRITPKDQDVVIDQNKFTQLGLSLDDVATTLAFLQKNDRSIEVKRWPQNQSTRFPKAMHTVITIFKQQALDTNTFHLRTLPKFPASVTFYEKKISNELPSDNALSEVTKKAGQFMAHKDGTISYKGNLISLQPKHQKVALLLIESYPNVVPSQKLLDAYWEDEIESNAKCLDSKSQSDLMDSIYDATSQVRKMLRSCDQKNHIKNVPGTGYTFLV